MKRNITKMAKEGDKILSSNIRCDLDTNEMDFLYRIYKNAEGGHANGLWELISATFKFGTANGYRIAKREAKKARTL